MTNLTSRKLAAVIAAILGIVGLLVGLALLNAALLADNKELLIFAIGAIAGLGGYVVNQQAKLDANGGPDA